MLLAIKMPQLVGIVLGVVVFTTTIVTVVVLLVKSNTLKGFMEEMRSGTGGPGVGAGAVSPAKRHQLEEPGAVRRGLAELYDCLIRASETLPTRLVVPDRTGKVVGIRPLTCGDADKLAVASNGTPLFDGSAYPLQSVWYWLEYEGVKAGTEHGSPDLFHALMRQEKEVGGSTSNVVLYDSVLDCPIGMLQLVRNRPHDLTVEVANVWVTPACRGKRHAHAALLVLMDWLFECGYRRVMAQADTHNQVATKFLERVGFSLEAVLRKHRIVERRNRDTSLYRVLNSDWPTASVALHRLLDVPFKPTQFPDDVPNPVPVVVQGKVELTSAPASSHSHAE